MAKKKGSKAKQVEKPASTDLAASPASVPPKIKRRGNRLALTIPQLEFCAMVARGVAYVQAAEEMGITFWQAYDWAKIPRVIEQIELYRTRLAEDVLKRISTKLEMRTEFVDSIAIHHLRKIKKQKKLGIADSKLLHSWLSNSNSRERGAKVCDS